MIITGFIVITIIFVFNFSVVWVAICKGTCSCFWLSPSALYIWICMYFCWEND